MHGALGHAQKSKGTGAQGPCVGASGKEEPGDGIDYRGSDMKVLLFPSSPVPSTCRRSIFSRLRLLCTCGLPITQKLLKAEGLFLCTPEQWTVSRPQLRPGPRLRVRPLQLLLKKGEARCRRLPKAECWV